MSNIVCFGEVLWDVFPSHKKIGGAPLNVAIRLQSLDNKVSIISSVGVDEKGDEIINFVKKNIHFYFNNYLFFMLNNNSNNYNCLFKLNMKIN